MVFAFPGPVVMPSRFCLPLHSGALSLAWDLGHFTACVAQRLLDPSVHPPPIGLLVVSGVWERQDKWSLFAGGKDCLQGIRESKKACCGSRHMSLGRAKAGQVLGGSGWGTRGMEEVAPWTSLLRPLGIPGSFPKEFLVCVFLPSATNCHSPDQTFLLSCPGWGLMAP